MSIRMVKCHTVYKVDLSAELEAKDYVGIALLNGPLASQIPGAAVFVHSVIVLKEFTLVFGFVT
ncbi:hypothetical protein ACHAXM_002863 [Skeletonema potamos]